MNDLTIGIAFFAGIASFFSPCVFSLVPAYVSYLSGSSAAQTKVKSGHSVFQGIFFILGFTVVFVLLGSVFAGVGAISYTLTNWLTRIGGLVVILFGLHMMHIITIPFLNYDTRQQGGKKYSSDGLTSFMMGIFFSAGWSPCVGPILGLILTFALNGGSVWLGALYLLVYSLGLGIPFLIAATQIDWVTTILRRHGKLMKIVEIVMGVVMILLGVLLLMDKFATLSQLNFNFHISDETNFGLKTLLITGGSFLIGALVGIFATFKGKSFLNVWFLVSGVLFVLAFSAVFVSWTTFFIILGVVLLISGLVVFSNKRNNQS